MVTVKPGMTAEIIVKDNGEGSSNVLKTFVHDVEGRKLILSQTTPPMKRNMVGRQFRVTFMVRNLNSQVPYSFWAELTALLADYRIASLARVPVIAMRMNTDPEIYNVRSSYRIQPLARSGMSLLLQGLPVKIVDISLGGAQVRTNAKSFLRPQSMVKVTLIIGNKRLAIDGQITRVWSAPTAGAIGAQHNVTLKFHSGQIGWESLLGGKIFQMEREMLAEIHQGKSYVKR